MTDRDSVTITSAGFTPEEVIVTPGTLVTFTNDTALTVVLAVGRQSVDLGPGGTYSTKATSVGVEDINVISFGIPGPAGNGAGIVVVPSLPAGYK